MSVATEAEMVNAIADATRAAARDLFERHPGTFYYFALISTGEALPCYISAWSWEALAVSGDEGLKWSYADSPFCAYGWDEFFGEVREVYARRPEIDCHDDEAWENEDEFRYSCMEAALRRLDREGLFGVGERRKQIVVNAEVMPPDYTNVERARRLNPPEALDQWLLEVAELH